MLKTMVSSDFAISIHEENRMDKGNVRVQRFIDQGRIKLDSISDTVSEYPKKVTNLKKYMNRGAKLFSIDAGEYIKELRVDDRI